MANKINPVLLVGGAVAAYLLLKPSAPATSQPVVVTNPDGSQTIVNNPVVSNPGTSATSVLPVSVTSTGQTVPTTYGINSGVKGGNGSFYTVANYAALLAANPHLGDPNYRMSQTEINQYLANYQDLRTGLPSWIGKKQPDGETPPDINAAALEHWKFFGAAEKRIFLPLQPPSSASYIPPPANTSAKSGSSSWIGPAIQTAGSIVMALLGNETMSKPVLNDAEVNTIVTGAAIAKKILPLYLQVDGNLVASINNRIDSLISEYQN